jgi:hypothetical protein
MAAVDGIAVVVSTKKMKIFLTGKLQLATASNFVTKRTE